MAETLVGKKIAILVTDGFEQDELLKPRKALDEAGATTQIVSPAGGKAKAWDMKEWGDERMDFAAKRIPAARLVTVEDVAGVVAFMCSPEAAMIRGQTVLIDGGFTLGF